MELLVNKQICRFGRVNGGVNMKSKKIKYLIGPMLLAVTLLAAVHTGFLPLGKAEKQLTSQKAVAVATTEASYISKAPKLALTGSIEGETSGIISPKIAGRIAAVLVEDGQLVAAGQGLVKLDSVEVSNTIRINNEVVRKAQATYDNTKINYERQLSLYEQQAISKQQLDGAETQLKTAASDVASALAGLDNAHQQLNETLVTAPVSGVVANKTAVIGQVVAAGQQLMTVENIEEVYAIVNIEQKDTGVVKIGMPAEILVDAYPGHAFTGSVEVINPAAQTANRMFRVKIKVSNIDAKLKPGMFVKVNLLTGPEQPVLAVPQSAIFQKQGLYYVFVVEDGKAVRRPVEVGEVIGDSIEIKSGLAAHMQVAASNVNNLKDGDAVVVTK
jgi:RND family efflux transporter MFP subunit